MTAPKGPKPKPLAERFNAFVDRSDADGCWIWTGSTASTGYGQIYDRRVGKPQRTHRIAWELHYGMVPPPHLCVMHMCDVRACVNPDHLMVGTIADNNLDMIRKGRQWWTPKEGAA